ncbi:DNA polymerase-3 subunit alpha [Desulfohalotomaculum tongense]|uniref:DNA polymerase III subunit alpha n=1 Tax=Desulforadius tongensis TaxID=1216062 RepID=UPI00308458D6|nr:DNA polymerase-3 subunit alpha [Desulforadius tongensis]
MKNNRFVHLHLHSEYSLLDGAARINHVVRAAADKGMPALAITDHGAMFGVVEFYKKCREEGIKPILGCEVYVAPRTMKHRTPKVDDRLYHLVLLAENQEGYQNLIKLVSKGYTDGFYYKPRVDKEALFEHAKGIIALSGCVAGEVAAHAVAQRPEKARQAAAEYRDIFGAGSFFLELQDHGFPEQKVANRELISISREMGLPLVATNDVHYTEQSHAEIQDVLMCIQTGKTVDQADRMKFQSDQLYLKSAEEMARLFAEEQEALTNTLKIAERCNVKIDFGQMHLPYYDVPRGYTAESYLEFLCYQGAQKRYGQLSPEVEHRLKHELNIIQKMGFSAYFLIVRDFVHYAKKNNIPVGPGRGSAAGSIVAYSLGITNIDPLRYGLLFERFLNPERVSMPDIDIDICQERRGEVIDYVVQKYGADKVAQIITFGTMAARAAIRDVGRALNLPYAYVDKVAKMVPAELNMTIEKALKHSPELKQLYQSDAEAKKLIDTAGVLEGMPRHASTHAAGIVISREQLTNYLPLHRTSDGSITTQFPMGTVEELGLLKMDLLGLRNLTVIQQTVDMLLQNGVQLDIENIPLDDEKTYQMLARGNSAGVFQLESSGMRAILKELKPTVFEDLIALVALYRPGPLGSGMVEDFIKNKHGLRQVDYLHPDLEPVLKETYGVILYQEQVMKIAQIMAGYSLGQADSLRKAMGKKIPAIMKMHREWFIHGATCDEKGRPLSSPIPGALAKGYSRQLSEKIFDLMEYFAGYGFNKSHSAAYALVAYQTAYLKANYPAYYMAALLSSVRDNTDKVSAYIDECRRMGIEVLPPDVNESQESFAVVGGKIRFGLTAVKNVGVGAVRQIIASRQAEGYFKNYSDFCRRIDPRSVNKRVLESLVKAGSFDSLGYGRAQLLAVVEKGLELAQQAQRDRESGQISLLDIWGEENPQIQEIEIPDVPEYSPADLLAMEKEALGLYISGHPLEEYQNVFRDVASHRLSELGELEEQQTVAVGGMISTARTITTSKGEMMAFAALEDITGGCELVVFPSVYRRCSGALQNDQPVIVVGQVQNSEGEIKVLAKEIVPLDKLNRVLYLRLKEPDQQLQRQILEIIKNYPGEQRVNIYYSGSKKVNKLSAGYSVKAPGPVVYRLQQLLGKDNVVVKWKAVKYKEFTTALSSRRVNKQTYREQSAAVEEVHGYDGGFRSLLDF